MVSLICLFSLQHWRSSNSGQEVFHGGGVEPNLRLPQPQPRRAAATNETILGIKRNHNEALGPVWLCGSRDVGARKAAATSP